MQSLISIVGLAVGITCFALCNSFLVNYLSGDKDLPHANRLYFMIDTTNKERALVTDRRVVQLLQETFPEVEGRVLWGQYSGYTRKVCEVTAKEGTKSYFEENFSYADSTFVDFFKFRLLHGSWQQVFRTPDAIVLTASTALKMFGKEDVIGETFVQVDDFRDKRITYHVVGVMEDFPGNSRFSKNSGLGFNDIACGVYSQGSINMDEHGYAAYILLRKDVSPESLNEKIRACKSVVDAKSWRNLSKIQLRPITQYSDYVSGGKAIIMPLIFSAVGLLVLLAALFNYVLFVSGCWMNRLKECGIRKVSGAGRRNLFILLVTEVTVSVVLALGVCFLLIELLVPLLLDIFQVLVISSLYVQLLQYGIGIIIIMSVLCWLVIRKVNRMTMLQNLNGGGSIRRKTGIRNVLLGIQLFICMLFLGASVFMRAQLIHYEASMLKGLSDEDKENIYAFNLNGDKLEPIRTNFINELATNPYVETYHRNGNDLFGGWMMRDFNWEGIREETKKTELLFMYADANYADFTKTPILKGRFYTPQEPYHAVVNELLARLMGGDPIGKEITVRYASGYQTYQIVGIIANLPARLGFDYQYYPCLYMPYPEGYMNLTCYVKFNPAMKQQAVEQLTLKLKQQLSPATRLYIANLSESVAFSTQSERKMLTMAFVFSLICIVICLLGIYSSMMLATERRRKEVAIRKINGAGVQQIIQLFCRTYFILLIAAFVVVTPLLYLLIGRWLEEYTIRISINVWPFIGLFLVMALIIFLTILTQLLRVIKINPAETLKRE